MTYSYYAPWASPPGTVHLDYNAPSTHPVMSGEARDMVVACDIPKRVYGFVNGAYKWHQNYTGWPRAIEIFRGMLFLGAGNVVEAIDPRSGHKHRIMQVPNAPGAINGISITVHGGNIWVIICFGGSGAGTVRGYHMNDLVLTEQWVNPQTAYAPRHAVLSEGWVFVCDTFGVNLKGRFYAVSMASGTIRESLDMLYPNHVQMFPFDYVNNVHEGLITEEHANRIVRWRYHPSASFTLEMAAPVAPFNDATKRKADIIAAEAGTFDPASSFTPPKSLCAVEAQGDDTLYSPNSARLYGADLLVADTDNHRVIIRRGGSIVTSVTGFNNPCTAVLI